MFVKICGINLDRVLSGKIFHIRKGVLSTVLGWLVFCRLDTYMSNKKNKVVIPILLLFVVLHCANIYIYTRDHLIVAIDSILVKKNNCAEYISGLPHRHLHLRSLCLHSRTCILWVVCMWESNVWKLPRHFKSEVKYPAEVCWCFCAYTLDLTLHCMRGVFAIKPSLLGCSLADQMYKM